MASPVGSLLVRIGADSSQLQRELSKSSTSLEKLAAVGKKAAAALVAGLAAATAAAITLTLKGVALGDRLAKVAHTIGATAEELAGFRFVAQQAGIETASMDKSMQRMGKTIGDAKAGLSTAKRALSDLGLTWQELEKLSMPDQFLLIGDRLGHVQQQTDKLRISADIFGRSAGADMVNVFKQGSAAIADQLKEAKALGSYLTERQSKVIEESADAQGRLKTAIEGVSLQMAAAFGPVLIKAANSLAQFIAKVGHGVEALARFTDNFKLLRREAEKLSDEALYQRLLDVTNDIQTAEARLAREMENGPSASTAAITEYRKQLEKLRAEEHDLYAERKKRREEDNTPVQLASEADIPVVGVADGPKRDPVIESLIAEFDAIEEGNKRAAEAEKERLEAHKEATKTIVDNLLAESDAIKAQNEWEQQQAYEHASILEKVRMDSAERLAEFEKKTAAEKSQSVLGELASMTAGVAQHSKQMFKLNKLAAIGNAVINTAQAVTKALASYPPPISFAMAAAQAAAGVAQISAIKSATFTGGGGGTTPSASGSTATVNGQPAEDKPSSVLINIRGEGERFSRSQVRELVEQINEAHKDGARLVFAE